jgi:hypothetical protein
MSLLSHTPREAKANWSDDKTMTFFIIFRGIDLRLVMGAASSLKHFML